MADNVSGGLPKRGKTRFSGTPDTITGQSIAIEGTEVSFRDDYTSGNDPRRIRSGRSITCRLVRNVSTVALLPGRLVVWKAGFRGLRVDGYSSTTGQEVAGVVDDQLPTAGVAVNDLFWLMRAGPALVKTGLAGDSTNAHTEGDFIVALTAAASTSTTAGRPTVQSIASTATTASLITNVIGRVMSARTAANTNTNTLIDLCLM